jgi:chemotaxis protein MotB
MVSYADILTLALALFVVLFTASERNASQRNKVRASARETRSAASTMDVPAPRSTGTVAEPVSDRLDQVETEIARALDGSELGGKVLVRRDRRGLVVSLIEAGFFDPGSAVPRAESLPTLDALARVLARSGNPIRVEGHTDDRPIRTSRFPSNWELSTARATWLVAHLIEIVGVDPGTLSAAGYGEFRPAASNETEAGRAQNRRVDLVVLSEIAVRAEPARIVPRRKSESE